MPLAFESKDSFDPALEVPSSSAEQEPVSFEELLRLAVSFSVRRLT